MVQASVTGVWGNGRNWLVNATETPSKSNFLPLSVEYTLLNTNVHLTAHPHHLPGANIVSLSAAICAKVHRSGWERDYHFPVMVENSKNVTGQPFLWHGIPWKRDVTIPTYPSRTGPSCREAVDFHVHFLFGGVKVLQLQRIGWMWAWVWTWGGSTSGGSSPVWYWFTLAMLDISRLPSSWLDCFAARSFSGTKLTVASTV